MNSSSFVISLGKMASPRHVEESLAPRSRSSLRRATLHDMSQLIWGLVAAGAGVVLALALLFLVVREARRPWGHESHRSPGHGPLLIHVPLLVPEAGRSGVGGLGETRTLDLARGPSLSIQFASGPVDGAPT